MSDLCTVAYKDEAHDVAVQAFHAIEGYTVTVVPRDPNAAPYDAEVMGLFVNDANGQWKVRLAKWDEDAGTADRNNVVELDIYDDIARVEVI